VPRGLLFDPNRADEIGLVAVGGDLAPRRLLEAYCCGVFPWFDEDSPILWWSPDPRAVIELDGLHVPRRLQRTLRSGRFRPTINRAFAAVIRACADRPGEGTWITPDMIAAYEALHALGFAYSLEVWCGDELAGGIYGVALNGLFAGESMFTRLRDGSKAALVFLVEHLRRQGFQLFDIQVLSEHTARFGGREIPRAEYLVRLRRALSCRVSFTDAPVV
jgi:leucyl/phenylalanyl-tRNA---protein transferase